MVQALVAENVQVQLSHDKEETDRHDHGWIKLRVGTLLLAENSRFQHNQNFHRRQEMIPDLVEQVVKHFADLAEQGNQKNEKDAGAVKLVKQVSNAA